jgi:hypothetical protein
MAVLGVLRSAALWLAFAGAVSAAAPSAVQPQQDSLEAEVRAVYLYNFARYITWPDSAFPNQRTPIRICVQGSDAFGDALDRAVAGETVNGRALEAVRLRERDSVESCHILYVTQPEERRLSPLLATVKARPVVTVGSHDRFLAHGGMIRFRRVDNRVRFDINLQSLESSGLRVSARLLGVAADVRR